MLYIVGLIIIIFLSLISIATKKECKLSLIILSIGILTLSGLRYGSGTDFYSYKYFYAINPVGIEASIKFENHMDIGYRILMGIAKYLKLNLNVFIFIVSTVSILFFLKVIKKFSKMKIFSLTIFICIYWQIYINSAIRQGISMGVIFYGIFTYAIHKKYKKYFLICSIAIIFHKAAIISLIIPIIIQFSDKYFYNISVNLVLLIFSFAMFLLDGAKLIYFFASILGIQIKYESGNPNPLAIALKCVMLIILMYLYYASENRCLKEERLIYIYWIGCLIFIAICRNHIFSRLIEYMMIIEIILIPNLVYEIRRASSRIPIGIMIIGVLSIIFVKDQKSFLEQGEYYKQSLVSYEYVSIFNKERIYEIKYVDPIYDID